MRDLKFRAWIPSQKIMVRFDLSACRIEDGAYGNDEYKECQIMQFTGLLDKNGKEIYEGDIVKTIYSESIGEMLELGRPAYDVILWDYGDRMATCVGFNIDKGTADEAKIVGNIYEGLLNETN